MERQTAMAAACNFNFWETQLGHLHNKLGILSSPEILASSRDTVSIDKVENDER